MKKFKTLFIALMVLVTAAIATFALVGCDKGNYLTVATNAEFPPFEYYEGDKIVGFDMEYIDAIAVYKFGTASGATARTAKAAKESNLS